jgi:peptide/nickel transport system substrate-binding protein
MATQDSPEKLQGDLMHNRLSRRDFLRRAAALGLSLTAVNGLLAACGTAPTTAPAAPTAAAPTAAAAGATPAAQPTTVPAATTAAAPTTINVHWQKPATLGPLFSSAGFEQQMIRLVLGALYKLSDTLVPVPELAERWEVSADSKVYTFYLRSGVKWSDGQPWSADDVVFTMERAIDKRSASILAGRLIGIKGAKDYSEQKADKVAGIEVPSPNVVRITLDQPDAAWLTTLGQFSGFCVLPKHILKDVPPDQLKQHAFSLAPNVGAGAYTFVRYETDQFAELRANPNYFRGKPAVDRIFLKILTPDVGVAQLERGELDVMNLPISDAARLKSVPSLTITSVRSPSLSQIGINNERPYFQDKRVRQAIYYAIDRKSIVASIMGGEAEVNSSPVIGPDWVGTPEINPYPYDPAKAKQLLKDANWNASQKVEMIFTAGNKEQDAYGPVIQQQLREAGMDVSLRLIEAAELRRRYVDGTDFDLFLFGGGLYRAEPSLTGIYYYKKNFTPAGGNGTHYSNPKVDELLDAGVATSDLQKRKAIYGDIAKIINDDAPTIFLFSPNSLYGVNKRLKGFKPPSYSASILWNAEDWTVG